MNNMRKLMEVLGDEGFVTALTNAEELVEEVGETLDRVERIEADAEEAVREANAALHAVDDRLRRFDETIRLLEAKIEAAFSIAFFVFALDTYLAGDLLFAAGLFFMGLLGASSLAVTVVTMPQVRRLRTLGRYARGQRDGDRAETDGSPDAETVSPPTASEATGESSETDTESGRDSSAAESDARRHRPAARTKRRWRTGEESPDE